MKYISTSFKWLFTLFICSGLLLVSQFDKVTLHKYFNSFHNQNFDTLFIWVTKIAEPEFIAICIISLVFFLSIKSGIILLLSVGFSGVLTQLLKHNIFNNWDRPASVFNSLQEPLWTIQSLEVHNHFSFPSGHTTAAFALFVSIHLIYKNNLSGIITFLLALLCGYSRIYLSQHFLMDVLAGAIVGTFISILFFHYLHKSSKLNKMNFSLSEFIKRK